jgi:hypothetical protein
VADTKEELMAFLARSVKSGDRPKLEVIFEKAKAAGASSSPSPASSAPSSAKGESSTTAALQVEIRALRAALAELRGIAAKVRTGQQVPERELAKAI